MGSGIGSDTRTVFTDTSVSVNATDFDNTQGGSYRIAGGPSINLIASSTSTLPSITVNAGSHECQAPVSLDADTTIDVASGASLEFNHRLNLNGNTLTKSGAGTLAISNDVVLGGGTINLQQGIISGNGTAGGDVTNGGGVISPGNSSVAGTGQDPEPGGILLMGLGLGLLVLSRASRKTRSTVNACLNHASCASASRLFPEVSSRSAAVTTTR